MPEYHFQLPIADEESLRLFLRHAFGVRIPDKAVCPGHVSPWHAFCEAYFARHRVSVWVASRGLGGKSFLLAMLGLVEALMLKADVTILGGSGEQSKRVHDYMSKAWNYPDAPRHLLASDPLKMETTLTWGNTIRALLASQSSVRGPHPQRLRLDEADETEISIVNAALGQPMSKGGVPAQTVLSSTHHHPDGTMTEILKMAGERSSWAIHEWCYKESMEPHGWLSADEVAAKRTDVTEHTWLVAFERLGRQPWPTMVQRFEARLARYRGMAQHDATGLGDVVDGYLTKPAYGVHLTGKLRAALFSNYINLIEQGSIRCPKIQFMYGEHLYARYGDLYGSGHPPDSFVAGALAAVKCGHQWSFAPVGS